MFCLAKMDIVKELLHDLDQTIGEFSKLLSSIPSAQFNTIPFEGSWTTAQLAEHIILSLHGFGYLLNGPVTETQRDAGAYVEKIRSIFMNLDIKLTAPDMVKPSITKGIKEELIADIAKQKASLTKAIETLDLTETCTAFALPQMGHITRLEAVHFVIAHTARHIHQLTKIRQALV